MEIVRKTLTALAIAAALSMTPALAGPHGGGGGGGPHGGGMGGHPGGMGMHPGGGMGGGGFHGGGWGGHGYWGGGVWYPQEGCPWWDGSQWRYDCY